MLLGLLNQKHFFSVVVIVVAVQLALAPLGGDPHDINYWISTGWLVVSEGKNPYSILSYSDYTYPPLWMVIITSYYALASVLVGPHDPWLGATDLLFYFFMKLPLIVASSALAFVISGVVRGLTGDSGRSRSAALLWLLNPYVIWSVAVAGMFDVIPALFSLLAIWFLLRDMNELSALMLGLGVSSKTYPLLFLPVMLLYIWVKNRSLSPIVSYTLFSLLIPLGLSIPFLALDPRGYIYANTGYYLDHFPNPTGLTIFLGLWMLGLDSSLIALLSQLAVGVTVLLVLLCMYRWSEPDAIPLYGSLSVLLVFFATNKVVNEQYLLWALPMVIVDVSTRGSRRQIFYHSLWFLFLFHLFSNIFFFKFFHEFLKHFSPGNFRSWVIFWMNRWSHRESIVQIRLVIRSTLGLLSFLTCLGYAWLINMENCGESASNSSSKLSKAPSATEGRACLERLRD